MNGTLFFTADDGMHGVRAVEERRHGGGHRPGQGHRPGRRRLPLPSQLEPDRADHVGRHAVLRGQRRDERSELWKSDGTAAGTVLVKDINPGQRAARVPHDLTNVNGTLFFIGQRRHARHGAVEERRHRRRHRAGQGHQPRAGPIVTCQPDRRRRHALLLRRRRGERLLSCGRATARRTARPWSRTSGPGGVGSSPGQPDGRERHALLLGRRRHNGRELWKSDGTAAGTVLVKDINPAGTAQISASAWANVNGTLFFTADDGQHGAELWKSDGTESGTVLVKDISPGQYYSSLPDNLTAAGGLLAFTADQRDHDSDTGVEVWVSDGTAIGTVLLKDIDPFGSSYPGWLTSSGGTLFFSARDFGLHGQELWKGTFPIANLVGPSDGVRYQPRSSLSWAWTLRPFRP